MINRTPNQIEYYCSKCGSHGVTLDTSKTTCNVVSSNGMKCGGQIIIINRIEKDKYGNEKRY